MQTKKNRSVRYFIYAALIHVGFVALLVFSLEWSGTPVFTTPAPEKIVEATAVDEKRVEKELKQIKEAEAKRHREEDARQRKLEEEAKRAEDKRKAEEFALQELKQKQEQEKLQTQQKKAAEKKELEELQKQKEAEAKKLAALEDKRKSEEAARKRAEAEKRMQEQLAAEEAALQSSQEKEVLSEVEKYTAMIMTQVSRNWIQPTAFDPGSSCLVEVKLFPTGEVVDVAVKQCKGGALFQRSVESAVRKASPLPVSKDPNVFAKLRDIEFNFKPEASP